MKNDEILNVLLRRRVSIAVAFAATLCAAAIVTFALPKAYSTRAYVVVNLTRQAGSDFEAAQVTQTATRTFAQLSETRNVAAAAADRLPFAADTDDVQDAISVQVVPDTQLLSVEATNSTPRRAQAMANAYARVVARRAQDLREFNSVSASASVADPAPLETSPTRPKPLPYLVVGALLAAFVGVATGIARDRLDRRVAAGIDEAEVLGLPVLGRMPRTNAAALSEVRRGGAESRDARVMVETARLILANLAFARDGGRPKTIAVVSAGVHEGKSTIALNLAWAAAELSLRSLLVDADLRKPSLSQVLSDEGVLNDLDGGLSDFLRHETRSLVAVSYAVSGQRGMLEVVPAGATPADPASLLTLQFAAFDERALSEFDFVVYDTPPVSAAADALLIAAQADAVVFVVDRASTRRPLAEQMLKQLRRARADVIGAVVNRVPPTERHETYGYGRATQVAPPREPDAAWLPTPPQVEDEIPRSARPHSAE